MKSIFVVAFVVGIYAWISVGNASQSQQYPYDGDEQDHPRSHAMQHPLTHSSYSRNNADAQDHSRSHAMQHPLTHFSYSRS